MAMVKRDDPKCYRKVGGGIKEDDSMTPCSGVIDNNACCGKGDQCMPVLDGSHFCFSPNNVSSGVSYYIAGCTDSAYKAGSCEDHCGQENYGAIKWQPNINQWACCGHNGVGHVDCLQDTKETFSGPSQQTLDNYRSDADKGTHAVKLAVGVIVGIVIAAVVAAALCCFLTWRCCFSRHARDKRSRGKFMPLGKTRGAEDVWDANMPHAGHGHELHEGAPGSYGYGGQGAPYHPPGQQGPQYTVANFR